MGLFDFFKKKNVEENTKYNRVVGLDYFPPLFSQFGSNIYASDVVQQAINCIVREMKKLEPRHIIKKSNGRHEVVTDSVQNALKNPNILMTTTDFIEKIIWNLFFNYNSFVYPLWEKGKLIALYPLQPKQVDFIQDKTGRIFVKLTFANDYESTILYEDIIHIRYNYSINEFMGGNELGQPDHKALLDSLELNNTLLNGVGKALKSSFAINGIVKYNTMIDNIKMQEKIKEFEARLKNNESGLMGMDIKGEYIPLKREIQLVDEATLKFIDEKILRHFGVSVAILTGDYTKEQYEAFFQKTIEPLIITLSQSFTKAIFSNRETFGFGHEIIFYHDKLDFMSMNEKSNVATLLSNTGSITVDELRYMFGLPPCEDEKLGKTPVMSKNFGNADSVKDMDKKDIDKKEDDDNNSNNKDDSDNNSSDNDNDDVNKEDKEDEK